jgi:hypothetical protein
MDRLAVMAALLTRKARRELVFIDRSVPFDFDCCVNAA